jgi:hypothetical protein
MGSGTSHVGRVADRLVAVAREIRAIRTLPRVTVRLGDDDRGRALRRSFTAPHRRYWVIGRKTIGVALLRIPEDTAAFLRGKPRQVLRTNITHARARGYAVSEFVATEHVAEILCINTSATARQGRQMIAHYTDADAVAAYCRAHPRLIGVTGADGLVAYVEPMISGQVLIVNRILGHHDHLTAGVMYLLMQGLVTWAVERRSGDPQLSWIMYDTMLGAKPGLRYFKERLGFAPYRVHWTAGATVRRIGRSGQAPQ